MSRIIRLGEHKWQLPEYPETQDDILYYHKPKDYQFWERDTDYPEFFFDYNPTTRANADYTVYDENTGALTALSREDTARLIELRDREIYRRIHGVWFMNNGVPTYLTGDHYFQLQWGAMKGYENPYDGSKYGEYREFQAHYQYFLQFCRTSRDEFGRRNCAGDLLVKPKKTGITQLMALNFLNRSTRIRERNYGIMSKSGDDVLDANFAYYLFGYDHLPFIFRPSEQNRTLDKIVFGNPRKRSTGSAKSILHQLDNSKGFNTTVFTKKLAANAFDGPVMEEYWCDEWTKFEDPYPAQVYKKTKETVKKQEVIHGIGHWTSYTPEDDSRSFREAKELWHQSAMSTMDKTTGMTKSEFFAYFISAAESGESGFDRYGSANVEKNTHYIMAKREQLKDDPSDLQAYMRQYPLTEEEAWREGGSGNTTFNNLRLGKRLEVLKGALRLGAKPYLDGKLEWVDGVRMGKVEFVPLTDDELVSGMEATWRLYHADKLDPDSFNVPLKNNIRDERGRLMPDESTPYVGANDPTEFAPKKGLRTASNCASTVMTLPNPTLNSRWGEMMSKRFIATYLLRPDNPRDMYEDELKKLLFFGCYELVEANRQWMLTMLIEDGFENFILVRNTKTKAIEPYNKHEHQTLIRTVTAGGVDMADEIVRAKKNYYRKPTDGGPDMLELMDDERIIEQDMAFDPADTKKSDFTMCSGLNIIAVEAFDAIKIRLQARLRKYNQQEMQAAADILLSL